MSNWLVTFQIDNNGEGVYCTSGWDKDILQRTKYANNTIFIQDGTKFDIKSYDTNTMLVQAPYFALPEHTLYRDDDLKKASVFCASKLKVAP